MRYFVHLAYEGTNYRGWQRQTETADTIQQVLEFHFSKMLKEKITLFGCGRTDAEVHASQYFMHFNYMEDIDFDLVKRINLMLPRDIRVLELIPLHNQAHAQNDAIARTYQYHIHFVPNPFLAHRSVYISRDSLDLDLLIDAVNFIGQQNDFKSMCKKPNQYRTTICQIAQFECNENEMGICFTITANRFLQSMIRLIVGSMLDVAQGKMNMAALQACFEKNQTPKFHNAALPQGLYLSKIEYPYLKRENTMQN